MTTPQTPETNEISDATRQATLIFLGTVEQAGATTMTAVPASNDTAIVRVDEIYRAPAALGDLTGSQLTVQLRPSSPVRDGQQAVFFTTPWLYGDTIAVQEVDRREVRDGARAASARLRDQITGALASLPDEELRQRIAAADAVVIGRVVNVHPAPQGMGSGADATAGSAPDSQWVTEHEPQWQAASLAVESVLKGDVPQATVTVLFPSSMDVMWFRAPKLQVGQEGVWLLHQGPATAAGAPQAYATVESLDALPLGEIDRVRNLIQQTRGSAA